MGRRLAEEVAQEASQEAARAGEGAWMNVKVGFRLYDSF